MRSIESIQIDIAIVKQAIREATQDGDEWEAELLYDDLDDLQEELYSAQTTAI